MKDRIVQNCESLKEDKAYAGKEGEHEPIRENKK